MNQVVKVLLWNRVMRTIPAFLLVHEASSKNMFPLLGSKTSPAPTCSASPSMPRDDASQQVIELPHLERTQRITQAL